MKTFRTGEDRAISLSGSFIVMALGYLSFFFAVADWLLIYNTSTVHISLTVVVVVVVVRSSRIAQKWLPNDSLAISSKEYSIRKSKTNDTLASEVSLTGFI